MASRSLSVGEGGIGFILAAVLLATACSSDSSVSFDPNVPTGDDDDTSVSGSSNGASGKGNDSSGSSNGSAGNDGEPTAGSSAAAGKDAGGASNGGTASSGGKDPGNGGSAGHGVAGQAGNGGGSAGVAGMVNGGAAGTSAGGTSAGMAGMGGAGSAGSGGMAGAGGSSGGNCTTGYFGAHNYAFCGTVESASAAHQKCESLGMQMASVESKMENDYLTGKQKGTSWLGGSDEQKEGLWRWASSTLIFWDNGKKVDGMYANWLDGQPNDMDNSGAPENCLVLTTSGWNDVACDKADMRALCESTGPVIGPGPGFP